MPIWHTEDWRYNYITFEHSNRRRWVVSLTCWPLHGQGNGPLRGLQHQSGQSGEEKWLVLAGNQMTFSPQTSFYNDYTNLALVPSLSHYVLHWLYYPDSCSLFIRLGPTRTILSWLLLPLYQTMSYKVYTTPVLAPSLSDYVLHWLYNPDSCSLFIRLCPTLSILSRL